MPEDPDAAGPAADPERPVGATRPGRERAPLDLIRIAVVAVVALLFLYICVQVGGALR